MKTPFQEFIENAHKKYKMDSSGNVADYIPQLTKTNPEYYGISITTLDGYTYDVGDTGIPFTIQSISKAFVFALAIELAGVRRVEETVSVEPSGEAFNSIRLKEDNRPYNPMVNAGAIACAGLICESVGLDAFENIRIFMSRFAGKNLEIDRSVFESERETGDRNRAIAWMLKNHSIIQGNVDSILDAYFQQCSVLVTSHDLSVMAATLANGGKNPITGDQVIDSSIVASTLSVMTSSGMYDYAGQWMYSVGMPSKSGVGGGIIAALPAQFGIGTFSPRLDKYGNSIRGIKLCEDISSVYGLHLLNRNESIRSCVISNYDIEKVTSRRNRTPNEQEILSNHHQEIRILELIGYLSFSHIDYLSRELKRISKEIKVAVLDLRRVSGISHGARQLLQTLCKEMNKIDITIGLSGVEETSDVQRALKQTLDEHQKVRYFTRLDDAMEWAEDYLIHQYGGLDYITNLCPLSQQELLSGLTIDEIETIESIGVIRNFMPKDKIIQAGDPPKSIFFIQRGMVSVKLPNGSRLTSFVPGMAFGEMALLDQVRTADIFADTTVQCLELAINDYEKFSNERPHTKEKILYNLSFMLSKRIVLLNEKIKIHSE